MSVPADASDAPTYERPTGVDDATVEAVGKVTEALEKVERARGHLYDFHQLTGAADLALDEAVESMEKAGRSEWTERLRAELVGRNVLAGRWTFQILDEYDAGYYRAFRDIEQAVRDDLVEGRRHVFEAEMKQARRTTGHPDHTAGP